VIIRIDRVRCQCRSDLDRIGPATRARWPASGWPEPAAGAARRGIGELASLRYRGGSDGIDLDRTVDQLIEHPVPEEDDIIFAY
jgi:hypothetical protein